MAIVTVPFHFAFTQHIDGPFNSPLRGQVVCGVFGTPPIQHRNPNSSGQIIDGEFEARPSDASTVPATMPHSSWQNLAYFANGTYSFSNEVGSIATKYFAYDPYEGNDIRNLESKIVVASSPRPAYILNNFVDDKLSLTVGIGLNGQVPNGSSFLRNAVEVEVIWGVGSENEVVANYAFPRTVTFGPNREILYEAADDQIIPQLSGEIYPGIIPSLDEVFKFKIRVTDEFGFSSHWYEAWIHIERGNYLPQFVHPDGAIHAARKAGQNTQLTSMTGGVSTLEIRDTLADVAPIFYDRRASDGALFFAGKTTGGVQVWMSENEGDWQLMGLAFDNTHKTHDLELLHGGILGAVATKSGQILFSASFDNGATWEAPVVVASAPQGMKTLQLKQFVLHGHSTLSITDSTTCRFDSTALGEDGSWVSVA